MHMPKRGLIFRRLGAAEMSPDSKTWPFLNAFVQRDETKLKQLHEEHHRYLRQFKVIVYLPIGDSSLGFRDFRLEEFSEKTSNGVNIARPYDNKKANSIIWQGFFESSWMPTDESDDTAEVTLKINSRSHGEGEIHFSVYPGRNHFIEMTE